MFLQVQVMGGAGSPHVPVEEHTVFPLQMFFICYSTCDSVIDSRSKAQICSLETSGFGLL